jgi:hypothetical protein
MERYLPSHGRRTGRSQMLRRSASEREASRRSELRRALVTQYTAKFARGLDKRQVLSIVRAEVDHLLRDGNLRFVGVRWSDILARLGGWDAACHLVFQIDCV